MKNYICLIFGLLYLLPGRNYASETDCVITEDTIRNVRIYFQFNQDEINADYLDNVNTIALLDSLFSNTSKKIYLDSLVIISLIVPEGSVSFNSWVAARRSEAVKDYLDTRYPHLCTKIVLYRKETDGSEIRDLIDYHRHHPEKCRMLLQYLNGQKPYRYIADHILPRLHQTEIQINWTNPHIVDSLNKVKSVSILPVVTALIPETSLKEPIEIEYTVDPKPLGRRTVLALKNNLLYDLALAPNLELEIPLGRRWSVNTEYKFPWWLNDRRNFCYQLLSGGVEGRCWLGSRHLRDILIGHFMGLYAEGGTYDFQFGEVNGYQGKYYAAIGASYGYTTRIARHLSLEFSLGAGYLTTDYRSYTSDKGQLIWKDNGRYTYIGLTKAKISLVWLITVK